MVPFGGGIFGVAAILVAPKPEIHHFWWLPLILDCGSLPMMARALITVLVLKIVKR